MKKGNVKSHQRKIAKIQKTLESIHPSDQDLDDELNADHEEHHQNAEKKHESLKKDYNNIALLMFLYLLQGLPLGLNSALPYILSSRKVSYADQATFSLAFWPFSLKLLWAPLVDTIYVKRFGLRKSWLIPVQYLIGVLMFLFSDYVYQLLENNRRLHNHNSEYSIYILTAIFFMFTFLAATQDIVVDGWALTMLSKENVAWASTCNSVGQTAGWFIGNVVFLTLDSADFCNSYIRPFFGMHSHVYGMVTLGSFMQLLGFTFIVSTTFVWFFKKEESSEEQQQIVEKKNTEIKSFTIFETYKLMWKLLYLAPIRQLALILITIKIGFATESMVVLKLIENDVPREKLSLLAVPLTPLQIILPLLISKHTNGPNALNIMVKAIPGRLVMGIICCLWVYITPYFKNENNEFPFYYYLICLLINALHSIFIYTMFVSVLCFFARISDKTIGGTYMTFLNTLSNIGNNWPSTASLYLASFLTFKKCIADFDKINLKGDMKNEQEDLSKLYSINTNRCGNDSEIANCKTLGGTCQVSIDAYYIETAGCIVLAILWLFFMRKRIDKLTKLPKSAWSLAKHKRLMM